MSPLNKVSIFFDIFSIFMSIFWILYSTMVNLYGMSVYTNENEKSFKDVIDIFMYFSLVFYALEILLNFNRCILVKGKIFNIIYINYIIYIYNKYQ